MNGELNRTVSSSSSTQLEVIVDESAGTTSILSVRSQSHAQSRPQVPGLPVARRPTRRQPRELLPQPMHARLGTPRSIPLSGEQGPGQKPMCPLSRLHLVGQAYPTTTHGGRQD